MPEPAAYLRIEGVTPEEVGETLRDLADDIFLELHDDHEAVSGVVPVYSPEHDQRLVEDGELVLGRQHGEQALAAVRYALADKQDAATDGILEGPGAVRRLADTQTALQDELRESPEEAAADDGVSA